MKTTKFSKRLLSLLLSLTVALSAFFGLPGGIAASATTTIPSAEKGGGLGISFVDSNSDSAQIVDRVVLTPALYLDGTYYVKVTNDYRSTASIESVSVSNGLSIASVTTVPGNGGVAYMFLSGKASSNNSICEITITYTLDGFEDYQNEQYSLTAKGFICCEYIQAQKSVDIACNYDAIQAQGYTQNVFAVASDAAWLTLKSVSGGCSVYDSTLAHDKVTSGETGSVEMDLYVDREAAGTVSWTELGLSHKIINRYTNKISVTAVPQFASNSNYSQVGSLSSGLTTSVNLGGTSGASSDTYYFNGTIPLGSTKNSAANIFSTSTALKLKASYYLNWSDMEVSIKFNVFSYDKSDLRDKIKICEGYCLNSALFDSQKWVVYQNALCAAKKVLGTSKTTQYAIYTALNNLNEAYTSLQRTCATDEQIADLRTFVNKYETVMNAPGNSYCWQAALLTDNKKYYDTALDYIDNQFTTTYENAEYLISKVSSFSYKTHRYSQDKKDATCTEDGYIKYSCSDCAYYYTETLNAKGHKMTPKVIAPTCTAVGYTIDVCSACGIEDSTTKRNITGSLGHDYVYSTEKSKLPTCVASGKATYVCSRCSASYSQNVPAKGHTYKKDKSTYSCTKNGFQDWICVDCEDSYQEDVGATGHKWVLSKKTGSKATYVCANKQCLLQSDGTYKTAGFTTDGNIDPGLSATVVRTQDGYYASRYDCNSTDEYYIKLFNNTDSDVTVQSITMTNGLSVDFTEQTLSARELKQFRITGTPTKVNSISTYTVTYDSGVCENSIYCAKDEVAAEDSNFQKVSFNSSFQIGLNLNDIFGQIYVEPAADLKYAKAATADTCFPISEWNAYVDKENMFFSDDTEIGDDAQHFDNYTWNNTMLSLELTSFQSSNSYTLSPIDLFSNTDGTMNFFYTGSELTNSTVILDKVAQSETAWVFFSGKLPTGSAVFKNRSDWTIKESSSSQTKSFKYLAGNFRINAFTYNKEKLRATVTEYETLGLNASDYTESNWTMYKNALDRATEVLGKQKTNQEEVDAAREDLQVAYEGLYNFYATDAQINSLRAFVTKYEALSAGTDSEYCDRQNLLSAYKEYYDLAVEYIDNQFKTFYDEAANLVKTVSGFSYNEHKFVVSENVPADCTNGAYTVKVCAQCGYTYNETTSAPLGHTWGDWTPAGDHTTHTRTCSVCNETETADCSYSVTDSKDATCTEDGYKTYTCSVCGDSYTEVLSATGHTWGDWTPAGDHATHTRTCSVCDTAETADCEYTVTDSEAATCTEDGYKTYTCSVCGDSYTEIVGTKAHTYSLVEVAPENGLDGYLYFVCEECSQVFLYDSGVAGEVTDIETAKNVGAVPSPSFNDYKSENEVIAYDYSLRGSSLKVDPQASLNTQDMRFTAALKIPEGAEVKDFGFVYTQTRFLNSGVEPAQDDNSCYGTEQFVSSNESVYKLSVMTDENGKFTRHTTASGIVYTFNLVIGVDKSNWSKHYAARSYIVYEYSGREYIVYDSEYSSRSVEWIARRICASPYEAESTKDFIDEKILKNL